MPATAIIYQQTQKCTIPILFPQAKSEEHTSTSGKVMVMMMMMMMTMMMMMPPFFEKF